MVIRIATSFKEAGIDSGTSAHATAEARRMRMVAEDGLIYIVARDRRNSAGWQRVEALVFVCSYRSLRQGAWHDINKIHDLCPRL